LGLGRYYLIMGPGPVGTGQPDPLVARALSDQLVDGQRFLPFAS
jgi:hypothetical protein